MSNEGGSPAARMRNSNWWAPRRGVMSQLPMLPRNLQLWREYSRLGIAQSQLKKPPQRKSGRLCRRHLVGSVSDTSSLWPQVSVPSPPNLVPSVVSASM